MTIKDNLEDDIKDGLYTGIMSSGIAAYIYGLEPRLNILDRLSVPTWAYIGATTAIGTTIAQILVDDNEPFISALFSAGFTVFANYAANSPVTPAIVAAVAAPTAVTRQLYKNKN